MNEFIKKSIILSLVVLLSFAFGLSATAEKHTTEIFYLESDTNMMITVEYTDGAPNVEFISPNGKTYGKSAINQGIMKFEDDGEQLTYWIPNAMAGQWKIVYDKGTNETLNIAWAPYVDVVSINEFSFTVDPDYENRLDVSLGVSFANNSYCDYTIYAVVTDENGNVEGSKELRHGSIRANDKPSNISIYLYNLTTYDNYRLMVEVSVSSSSVSVTDQKISDRTFTYINENTPSALENIYLEINAGEESLKLDWDDYEVYCKRYIVMVYADNNSEPYYLNEFESGITSTEILIDPNFSKYKVQIAYVSRYTETVSEPLTREIDMSLSKSIVIGGQETSSNSKVNIDYDFSGYNKTIKTVVSVNASTHAMMLSGKGSLTAQLEMFENDVKVYWYLDDNTVFVASRSIYFDNLAPLLVLPEIVSEIKTDKANYILTGYTDPGCVVTVNGIEAETDESGSFSFKLDLIEGKNEVSVITRNALGNNSVQNFTITRASYGIPSIGDSESDSAFIKFIKSYIWLLLTVLASAVLVVYVFVCRKICSKYNDNKKSAKIFRIAGMALCYLAFIAAGFFGWSVYKFISISIKLNSMDFYEQANESALKAYEWIEKQASYQSFTIVSACVFAGLLLLAVLTLLLSKKMSKKGNKKADNKKSATTPVPYEPKTNTVREINVEAPTNDNSETIE